MYIAQRLIESPLVKDYLIRNRRTYDSQQVVFRRIFCSASYIHLLIESCLKDRLESKGEDVKASAFRSNFKLLHDV